MINAGDLTEKLTLKKPTITRSSYGSEVITYETEAMVWAEHVNSTGREFYAAQKMNAEITDVFRMRYRHGMDSRWCIGYGIRNLQITYIDDSGRRNGEMLLHCKEVV